MSATGRLLAIAWRRNAGHWLILLAVVFAASILARGRDRPVWPWTESQATLLNVGLVLRADCAGVAAWVAERDRRRGIEDLLASTARPAAAREFTTWAATALWGALALGLITVVLFGQTVLRATWGALRARPVVNGCLAILAAAALGYALGSFGRGRSIAPFVAVATLLGTFLVGILDQTRYLALVEETPPSIWYNVRPDPSPRQALWLVGLILLGIGIVALRRSPGLVVRGMTGIALALTISGTALLYDRAPSWAGSWYPLPHNWAQLETADFQNLSYIPYEPVCDDAALRVCVHPAYREVLPDVSAMANRIAAPVVGLPGVPTRAEQLAFAPTLPDPEGVIGLDLEGFPNPRSLARQVARGLTRGNDSALTLWLARQAGYPTTCEEGYPGNPPPNVLEHLRADCAAADRFATLPPNEQRAWLEANIGAVRGGRVGNEDLPGGRP